MKTTLARGEISFRPHEASGLQPTVLPHDLRAAVSEQTLVKLVLEAVQAVEWSNATSWPASASEHAVPPSLLTTVLIYSYAVGVVGSRDIEILARHDPVLCYLCGSNAPDSETLRLFRRQHVRFVTHCLETLLETVWKVRQSNGSVPGRVKTACRDLSANRWRLMSSEPDFACEAEQRVTRAIHVDSMAMDE